jgi:glycosyltransferase involved in cell wall biosynthesis
VIHVHTFRRFEIFVALLAAKIRRKKIVLTTHNPFTANLRNTFLQIFVFLNDQILGKVFLRFVDEVICLVEEEIQILKKYHICRDKIRVIPNGISEDVFKQGSRRKFLEKLDIPTENFKYKVLWVGRINKVKGLENLETVVKQMKEALFIFIGPDADASQEVKAIYEGCENVVFTGPIKHNQIINAYCAADLFVLPSIHEPFGIVLLEAMAQGVPIVATNVGGPRHIVKESFGITQNPKDQWAWMLNIEKILKNKELREQMSENAKKEAEKYRWSNLVFQVLEVYKV